MARFARKDATAEKVREAERQQLRDQIKRERELKNFKKISKVIQYAAFICPGPIKRITSEADLPGKEKKKEKDERDMTPETKARFKNWQEEKEFEEKLER